MFYFFPQVVGIPPIHSFVGVVYFTIKAMLTFLMAQWVKNQSAMQEMQEIWVQSLGRENPLEEEMATHSSILALEIPLTEKSGGLQSLESKESDTT